VRSLWPHQYSQMNLRRAAYARGAGLESQWIAVQSKRSGEYLPPLRLADGLSGTSGATLFEALVSWTPSTQSAPPMCQGSYAPVRAVKGKLACARRGRPSTAPTSPGEARDPVDCRAIQEIGRVPPTTEAGRPGRRLPRGAGLQVGTRFRQPYRYPPHEGDASKGVNARVRPRCTVQMLRAPRALQRLCGHRVKVKTVTTAIGEFKSRDNSGRAALFDVPERRRSR
jgi:hypothetical protein